MMTLGRQPRRSVQDWGNPVAANTHRSQDLRTMTIEITPELGVELTPDIDYLDLRMRAEAVCRSILLLEQHGLDTEATAEDVQAAAKLTTAYAEDPERTSKLVNNARSAAITPASLKAVRNYLDEYGHAVVTHAIEVRHLVTNRLLEESQNPDPRIRIRALELLGKHSDVGLFSEKAEVTITHQTTDELKARLKQKLQRLIRKDEPEEEPLVIDGEIIDVDAELGLTVEDGPKNTVLDQNNPENRTKPAQNGEIWEPESE
jgi:acetyl/propionyl-CoA carboxylase alpha subunit